jgi:hypothetical protein
MRIFKIRFFGIISGLLIVFILTILSFVFRFNVLYINVLGQIPLFHGLIPIISLLILAILNKRTKRTTLNWIYLGVVTFTFIYLNSMFQWSVDCCPNEYDSLSNWNAAKGLSWIIYLPLTFILTLIQGLIFDLLREIRIKSVSQHAHITYKLKQ